MKRSKKLMGLTAVIMGVVMATAACGSSGGAAETKAADSAAFPGTDRSSQVRR